METNIYDDFSTDYETDPDTGQINVPTRDKDVKLSDYDILKGIELTQSATDYLPLPIDKDYGCNELCDGYEANAVPDNIRAQRIDSAGYAIGLKKEQMAIEALKKGTEDEDTTALTENNVYKKIAAAVINMKKRGMKLSNMRVVISADTELLLLSDEKYANTSSTIGAELVREGITGKIAGAPTKPNYHLDDDIEYIIYDKRYIQKYEVWKKEPAFEDLKDGKHIGSSALQGRQVGGLMVTNKLGVQLKKKASQKIKVSVPSGETSLNLGEKTVQDLCENLSIDEIGKVTGSLKHVDNWIEFSKTDNSGNFIPLYFEEAKGQPKGTIKCELKGTGAKLKKPVSVDEKDGLIVFQVHNKDNTIEITSEGKETKTLTLTEVELKTN